MSVRERWARAKILQLNPGEALSLVPPIMKEHELISAL